MALDYPPQDYFPAWKLRLAIRLEEFDQGVLKPRVPEVPTKNLKGLKQDRAPLDAVPDPEFPGRFLLKSKVSRATDEDASKIGTFMADASSDGLTHVISGIIPRKFDWKQNGFRAADELKATLRWIDFPIDPRVVRSVAVQFYFGTLTATEYAQGVRGVTRGQAFGSGIAGAAEALNVIPDTYLDSNGNRRSNLRFSGWVDKFRMIWNEEEPSVDLECRDNTQLMLVQEAPPQLVIGMKDPIHQAIATYLSNFPQFAGLTVEYRGAPGADPPKLDGALAGTAFRPNLGPQPSKGAGGGEAMKVWDYLTDVCGAIGHVCRIDGNAIIVQRASTLLHGEAAGRADDPYRGRKLSSGNFPVRAFIYGKNLSQFEVARDLSSKEAKNVELRCWSPRRKNLIVARFPKKEDRLATSTPGDARADNKWTVVRVDGVESQEILQQMAEDYYHGRNRNEIEVVMKTWNFASFGGGNEDPDLLDAKPGDAVEVLVDRSSPSTTSTTEKALSAPALNEQRMIDLGYDKAFAVAYANAYANAGFQRLYRIKEMSASGDVDEGVSFELRSANFVQVRADKAPAASAAPPNASSAPTQGGKPGTQPGQATTGEKTVADAGPTGGR